MQEDNGKDLLREFDKEMHNIYKRARDEAGYNATRFLQMLHENGGFETARYLINAKVPSEGYTALWERNHLDLTVEVMILNDKRWRSLFSEEELAIAKKRLQDYNYKGKIE